MEDRRGVRLGLAGEHQVGNAGLAVTALALAAENGLFSEVTSAVVEAWVGAGARERGLAVPDGGDPPASGPM